MNTKHNIPDLVHRVKQKDLLAMKILYQCFVKEMLTLSYRMTQQQADAEDIVQESFMTSFQKIHQLKEAKHYRAWLKKMVVNNSLKLLKKKVNFTALEAIGDLEDEKTDAQWYKDISFDIIKSAIGELPNGCRQIFTLYLLENYKHREIAALLGISVSTSKSQYRYALKLMKLKLIQYKR